MPPTSEQNNNEVDAARERARLAMGGEKRAEENLEKSKVLEEKRKAAAFAMEGSERRQRREAKEHELKEKQDMLRRIDEEVKRREAETQKKKEEAEAARKNQITMRENEIKQKEDEFAASQNIIEKLKEERGSTLKTIHTLQSDLAEAVKNEGITTEKIIISEQKRQNDGRVAAQTAQNRIPFKKLTSLFAIIVIAILGGLGYWYFSSRRPASVAPANVTVPSIVFAEKYLEINTASQNKLSVETQISKFLEDRGETEQIGNVYFTKESVDPSTNVSRKELLAFKEWQKSTSSAIPEDFSRFVTGYMVGTYQSASSSSVFVALKIDPFDNVYRAMLDHERDWVKQFLQNLNGKNVASESIDQSFSDVLLKNLNTRVLRDKNGNTLLIYSFLDPRTLIVAENESALYYAHIVYNTPRPR